MYSDFNLSLMLNHACNFRCSYCYTGNKFNRAMTDAIGEKTINRAVASVRRGGSLTLGLFGGEPLIEAERCARLIDYAFLHAAHAGMDLRVALTTNGTYTSPSAWSVMMRQHLHLAVSCDGLPEIHDRHRALWDGRGSFDIVLVTLLALLEAKRDFSVVMVVRPDTLFALPDGVRYLRSIGVRHFEPTLDLWADWSLDDVRRLEAMIGDLAEAWREGLPDCSISWFDEKAAAIMGLPSNCSARCAYGCGQVAVAPSGRLYPCERLIGEDDPENPTKLPGHAMSGMNFLEFTPAPARAEGACARCDIRRLCTTTCRCSNVVRTGRTDRPDALLCVANKACARACSRVLEEEHICVPL